MEGCFGFYSLRVLKIDLNLASLRTAAATDPLMVSGCLYFVRYTRYVHRRTPCLHIHLKHLEIPRFGIRRCAESTVKAKVTALTSLTAPELKRRPKKRPVQRALQLRWSSQNQPESTRKWKTNFHHHSRTKAAIVRGGINAAQVSNGALAFLCLPNLH